MESLEIEYKWDIPEKEKKLKEEIVSFLNADGGEIHLGVKDNGEIDTELIKAKRKIWEDKISNWIKNAFLEDVTHLIKIFPNEIPFKIKINKGDNKPYCVREGSIFNYSEVYIRISSKKQKANSEQVERLILEKKASKFENWRSKVQSLTFNYLQTKLEKVNIEFNEYKLRFKTENNEYNNLAFLLSDQNDRISKLIVFNNENLNDIIDKKGFKGSIIKQIYDIFDYLFLFNKLKINFNGGPERQEKYDYPKIALREIIINCFCHRDWIVDESEIMIKIFSDKINIISPGPIVRGLTLEQIKKGANARRNKNLVDILAKLNLIENYGTGIERVFESYSDFYKKPDFNLDNNNFSVILYNKNYKKNIIVSHKQNDTLKSENDTLDSKNITLKLENDALKSENITLKLENDTLKSENDTLDSKNITLKLENDTLKSENITLKLENDTLKSENDTLKHQNDTLKSENVNLNNGNVTLKHQNDTLKHQNDTLKSENDTLKPKNDTLKHQNDTLKSENVNLNNGNLTLKHQNDTLKSENDTLKHQNDTLKSKNDTLKHQNDTLNSRNDTLKHQNDTLKHQNDTLKSENVILNRENITLKLKNFTLNNKNDTLKNNELNKNKETSKENLSSSFSKTKERLDLILKLLKDNEKLTIQELADILKISRITIIRDLNYLQKNKKIERISGKKTGFWKII